jgi:hypothetical protein
MGSPCASAAGGARVRLTARTTASPISRMGTSVGMAGGESSRLRRRAPARRRAREGGPRSSVVHVSVSPSPAPRAAGVADCCLEELAALVEHALLDDLVRPQQQRLRDREAQGAFAVLRLITNSNLVGCSTGRSAGLAPLSQGCQRRASVSFISPSAPGLSVRLAASLALLGGRSLHVDALVRLGVGRLLDQAHAPSSWHRGGPGRDVPQCSPRGSHR